MKKKRGPKPQSVEPHRYEGEDLHTWPWRMIDSVGDLWLHDERVTFAGYYERFNPEVGAALYSRVRQPSSTLFMKLIGLPADAVNEKEFPRASYAERHFTTGGVLNGEIQRIQIRWAGIWPLGDPTISPDLYAESAFAFEGELAEQIVGVNGARTNEDILAVWRALKLFRREVSHPGGRPKGTGVRFALSADLIRRTDRRLKRDRQRAGLDPHKFPDLVAEVKQHAPRGEVSASTLRRRIEELRAAGELRPDELLF